MCAIRKDFLQYVKLTKVTGYVIATSFLDGRYQLGLDVENACGQGYDEASNMSCEWIGLLIE